MIAFKRSFLIVFLVSFVYSICEAKYKICIVNGREVKHSTKYCPKLEGSDSPVECVIATDRLDCLRRIHKGTADFGVFTAEDLVTATNSQIDLLITNELRYFKDQDFEYEVVAVVANQANIRSKHDIHGKRYCHPGYGYEADWTRILSNYFEASVVIPSCDSNLTITENRVKASSKFFGAACKAGPWVNNNLLDAQLKNKYPNLCAACGDSTRCSSQDKYWGRRGSLFCLTDGAGDVSWARLEDVRQHFGFTPGGQEATPEDYSLLCPDDTTMPLSTSRPCIWVVKPWSVIGSRSAVAKEIQSMMTNLNGPKDESWKKALSGLVEPIVYSLQPTDPIMPIETYFDRAKGFLNANSFSSCHPPRTIRICTTSNIETAKCSWLRESAAVYGIEPDLDCLKADNTTHCMMALTDNAADVVMVSPDLVHTAINDYHLKTLFYETVADENKYITVAVIKKDINFRSFEEFRGATACFPVYDGIAWNSVIKTLQRNHWIGCNTDSEMANFFKSACVPNLPSNASDSLKQLCNSQTTPGDIGALSCLDNNLADVAFVSTNSINKYLKKHAPNGDFKILCQGINQPCHLSWAPIGQAMVRSSSSDIWLNDTLDVFVNLNRLFGKDFKDTTNAFTMFGSYDGVSDVLFHDATEKLRNLPIVKHTDRMDLPYEELLAKRCTSASSKFQLFSSLLLITTIILVMFQ